MVTLVSRGRVMSKQRRAYHHRRPRRVGGVTLSQGCDLGVAAAQPQARPRYAALLLGLAAFNGGTRHCLSFDGCGGLSGRC